MWPLPAPVVFTRLEPVPRLAGVDWRRSGLSGVISNAARIKMVWQEAERCHYRQQRAGAVLERFRTRLQCTGSLTGLFEALD